MWVEMARSAEHAYGYLPWGVHLGCSGKAWADQRPVGYALRQTWTGTLEEGGKPVGPLVCVKVAEDLMFSGGPDYSSVWVELTGCLFVG